MAHPHTQTTIRSTFISMLNEMPLNKITVKGIVTACNLNRNTFYYYYADIYEIIHEIFDTELDEVFREYNDTLSWEESFLIAVDFALKNKKALYHVYNSVERESMEKYLFKLSGTVIDRYITKIGQEIAYSADDKKLIAAFYQSALTGMIIQWIADGMKGDPEEIVRRIGQLFNGNILLSLKRSAALCEHT